MIEFRSWQTKYRRGLLINVGKGRDKAEIENDKPQSINLKRRKRQ